MKHIFTYICCLTLTCIGVWACSTSHPAQVETRYSYHNILNIAYTPDSLHNCQGWFTDAGSWMGFTLPEKNKWVNGFCGPFSLDMFRREWIAQLPSLYTCFR